MLFCWQMIQRVLTGLLKIKIQNYFESANYRRSFRTQTVSFLNANVQSEDSYWILVISRDFVWVKLSSCLTSAKNCSEFGELCLFISKIFNILKDLCLYQSDYSLQIVGFNKLSVETLSELSCPVAFTGAKIIEIIWGIMFDIYQSDYSLQVCWFIHTWLNQEKDCKQHNIWWENLPVCSSGLRVKCRSISARVQHRMSGVCSDRVRVIDGVVVCEGVLAKRGHVCVWKEVWMGPIYMLNFVYTESATFLQCSSLLTFTSQPRLSAQNMCMWCVMHVPTLVTSECWDF